jgi:NlpC/P60 family
VTGAEAEAAARLLERLLTDPAFRAQFRRNPVAASREAGLESVAEEMAIRPGKAMETLDGRESRSSLAGVFMAAAFEGAGIYDFSRDLVPHLEGIPEQVEQVLSRVHSHGGLSAPAGLADLGAPASGAALIEDQPAPVNAAGQFSAITPEQAAAARSRAPESLAQPPPERAPDSPPPADADPGQYGQEGAGGRPSREALALLDSKRVAIDASGAADLKAGRIDPRVVSVLTAISRGHRISVSAMASDHQKFTSGGSISNHFHGRAVDIATVDGRPVGPGNAAARELAIALSRLDSSVRPSEIGSPWALPGPAYFTDSGHQDHVHIGFDEPIASSWKAPEELAASESDPADADAAPASGEPADEPESGADAAGAATAEDDGGGGAGDGGDPEPGGLEDPGGDTDAEADAESDGEQGGDGEDDSDSDDASDEEEDDENEGGESSDEDDAGDSGDGGSDGDHDDNSDSSDGGDGSDSADSTESGDGSGGRQLDLGDVAGSTPSDTAAQPEIAAWMGSEAQKRGLPSELPVMAALVESGMRNLDHGHADSVGYFQMRAGIWNQGEYAGYPNRPELQLKWFLDHAEAVKRQRIAAGKSVDDPEGYGEWIADIERPAAQYRGRYQLRLGDARDLLRQSLESGRERGGRGAGVPAEPVVEGGGDDAGPRALTAVAEAKKHLGTPYQWGGSTPQTGFDCSGLVQWAYAKAGIEVPRTSEQQILASNGRPVDRGHLRLGDLVFFRNAGGDVHHVGISLGGDKFINAPHTGAKVRVDDLSEPYYAKEFAGGRRFDVGGDRGEQAAGEASGVDPEAARRAEASLARDAAEAQRPGTLLFEAVRAQELRKADHTRALRAVDPSAAT